MIFKRFVTIILLLVVCPAFVWGDERCFVPFLAVNEQYNNNILLATETGEIRKDYITILSPGFEMADKTARLDSLMSLQLDSLHYARNRDLDATNQHYGGSIRYAATPRLSISADAAYTKDSNPSLQSVNRSSTTPPTGISNAVEGYTPTAATPLSATGDQTADGGNPPATTVVIPLTVNSNASTGNTTASATLPLVAVPVQRISSSASMDYRMTETTSLSAIYRFGWSSYEIPQYRDQSHDGEASVVIDLSKYLPRVKGMLNAGYSQYLLPNMRTINVTGTAGFSYDVSETFSILLNWGVRRTDTELFVGLLVPPDGMTTVRERLDNTEKAGTGAVTLNYNGEYSGAGISYVQDFTMAYLASGYQAPAERQALSFTARHQMTRELSARLTTGYTTYTAAHILTQRNIYLSPTIRYELVQLRGERDLALEASYEHARIDYTVSGTANRDLYFIRLSVRFPYCSSSQYK